MREREAGGTQGRFSWSGWVGSADRICAPNGNVHIYLSCFDFALIFQLFFLFLFFVYFIFSLCVCEFVLLLLNEIFKWFARKRLKEQGREEGE